MPIARVLVADDDPGVLKAMASALGRAGFQVTAVEDGAPAIELAETSPFELVVVDLNMRTSGLSVVRHYKQKYGTAVYCAVLSGDDGDTTHGVCVDAGADEVFVKPAPASVIRRRLIEVALALRGAVPANERTA